MATSVGETIMQLIAAALNAPGDKPRTTVRQRTNPINLENEDGSSGLDEFLLYAVKETSEYLSHSLTCRRERHVRIEIPVAGSPPLDSAADPLCVYIVQTLLSDVNLWRGISLLEELGQIWETDSSYVDASVCVLELKITYVTTLDPAVAAMSSAGS
jgi:hypothetical protein